MNPALVPSYDMLGLPAPAWLAQALMALTLALHWTFLGGVLGGALLAIAGALPAKEAEWAELGRRLLPLLPFGLSMAMTLGIAPLLFVQVLYGQFFYTANILLGFWWLALLVLVIAAFYFMWLAWYRAQKGGPLGWLLLALTVLVLAKAAVILSTNATLMQSPEVWEGLRPGGMGRLRPGDATLIPRLLFALSGFVAVGGLWVAILGGVGLLPARGRAAGLALALPALIAQGVFGIVLVVALPGAQRAAALAGGPESAFSWLAALAFGGTAALAWRARKAQSRLATLLPGLTCFVGLLSLAAARDAVRRAALAPHFRLSETPVHAEWSSFLLFLVTFVVGLGVIAWLIRLGRPVR